MPTEILMKKRLGALRPVDAGGDEVLRGIGAEETVMVRIKRPRSPQHHRKFFAMLGIVLKNQEHYKNMDDLLNVCKLRVGHVTTIATKLGDVQVPKSISFASMDQTAFRVFYDAAVDWVTREVIPGLKRGELDAEVEAELREFSNA